MKFKEARLIDYCKTKINTKKAIKFLEENSNLDLTIRDGLSFIFAIKKDNPELLQVLIEYYKANHLKEANRDSAEYKSALFRLKKILDKAEASYEWSVEIQKVLSPYIEYETDDNGSEADFDGLEPLGDNYQQPLEAF